MAVQDTDCVTVPLQAVGGRRGKGLSVEGLRSLVWETSSNAMGDAGHLQNALARLSKAQIRQQRSPTWTPCLIPHLRTLQLSPVACAYIFLV